MVWVSKEPFPWDGSFEHPKHMFEQMEEKIFIFFTLIFNFILRPDIKDFLVVPIIDTYV